MNGTRTLFLYCGDVLRASVALIACESVSGINFVEFFHKSVARNLCDNGGATDAVRQCVAFNNGVRFVRNIKIYGVDKHYVGSDVKLFDCAFHRVFSGVQNIDFVYVFVVETDDGLRDGGVDDGVE